jgi:hypothetical protein
VFLAEWSLFWGLVEGACRAWADEATRAQWTHSPDLAFSVVAYGHSSSTHFQRWGLTWLKTTGAKTQSKFVSPSAAIRGGLHLGISTPTDQCERFSPFA